MPSKFEWLDRIKAVEREYSATRFAVERLLEAARYDPSAWGHEFRSHDLDTAWTRLEGTYLIRLFAEFEASLRRFWATRKATTPPAGDLLNGVGARCRTPHDQLSNAHHVRDYRNSLVHEQEVGTKPVPISIARSHLCRYLSFLPLEW